MANTMTVFTMFEPIDQFTRNAYARVGAARMGYDIPSDIDDPLHGYTPNYLIGKTDFEKIFSSRNAYLIATVKFDTVVKYCTDIKKLFKRKKDFCKVVDRSRYCMCETIKNAKLAIEVDRVENQRWRDFCAEVDAAKGAQPEEGYDSTSDDDDDFRIIEAA